MVARIYRPARTAMQSGNAGTRRWRLEYEPETPRSVEPLMGWTSSSDMKQQVRLSFESKEEAIDYCVKSGIAFRVEETRQSEVQPKSYSDNFRYGRIGLWTH